MTRDHTIRTASCAALGAALLAVTLAVPGGAHAAPAPAPAATSGDATIRAAHFSPDTVAVDVYLTKYSGGTSRLWLSDLGYGDVGPYRRLAAGLYVVSMRNHDAPASQPASLTWTLDARAGHAYTAAAVGMNADLRGIVLPDNLRQPASGHARVRLIQAASRAPTADVSAGAGTTLGSNVAFAGTTGYVSVRAGRWTVTARASGSPTLSVATPVRVRAGTVNTLVLLDSRRPGLELRTVLDASAASATPPKGSIDAGGGGLAPGSVGALLATLRLPAGA